MSLRTRVKLNKKHLAIVMMALVGVLLISNIIYAAPTDVKTETPPPTKSWLVELIGGAGNLASAGLYAILGVFIQGIAWFIGQVLTVITAILLSVAQYNNFIDNEVVNRGWPIVRDICNMFFILILLIIAFAAILRVESYNIKRTLPKLLIMAILINFSKTISGLLIDFGQVIMLTFVNAFASAGGGNLYEAFGINKLWDLKNLGPAFDNSLVDKQITGMSLFGSLLLGLIILIITGVIIATYTVILVYRIVMLWIYIILSPLAFLASAFPAGARYAAQWWGEFTKLVIVGPIMAFFLWLALVTVGQVKTVEQFKTDMGIVGYSGSAPSAQTTISATLTEAGSQDNLTKFIVSSLLLVGALVVAQQMGGTIGNIASKGLMRVKQGALLPFKTSGWLAGYGARKLAAGTGVDIRPTKIIAGIKENWERVKKKEELSAQRKAGERLERGGLGGVLLGAGAGPDWANQYVTGFMNIKGFRNMFHDTRAKGKRKVLGQQYRDKEQELELVDNNLKNLNNFQTRQDKAEKEAKYKLNQDRLTYISNEIPKAKGDEAKKLQNEYEKLLEEQDQLSKEIKIEVSLDKENLINQRGVINNELGGLKKQLNLQMPARAFESRAAYRTLVNEEKSKIKDVKNSDELAQLFMDAERKKEKYRMVAIAERLFEDANGNELLNDYGLPSSAVGLHRFINERMIGSKIFSQKEGLQLQSDLSGIAQEVNHWEMAKTVGVNPYGEMESLIKRDEKTGKWDDSRHALAAASDIYKLDPQGIVRQLNRLAFGGETPRPDGTRTFDISTLGLVLAKGLTQTFKDHENRLQANAAFNLAQPQVVAKMVEAGVPEITINIMKRRGSQEGRSIAPQPILEEIKDKDLNLTDG